MTTLAVIGSIILVLIFIFGFLFWRNHKKEDEQDKRDNPDIFKDVRNLN